MKLIWHIPKGYMLCTRTNVQAHSLLLSLVSVTIMISTRKESFYFGPVYLYMSLKKIGRLLFWTSIYLHVM